MCDTVLINGVVCETMGQLSKHLDKLVLHAKRFNVDECLCNCDIEASAKKSGYKASIYYDQVADWKLTPASCKQERNSQETSKEAPEP